MEGSKEMTIRTRRLLFLAFVANTWICLSPAVCQADAAAISPIASTAASAGEPIGVEQHGPCQEYVESADGCGNILSDNILTRAIHSFSRDFRRNNCWPRPFVWKDREATRTPFVVMANKGWQRENTLGEFHFDQDTGKLNEPGRLRVYWIVNQELPQRHVILVHRAMRTEETEARIDSVQKWTARIVSSGTLPPVLETNIPAPGRAAEEVDHIRVEYLKSMPAPRLPANESIDSGSSDI